MASVPGRQELGTAERLVMAPGIRTTDAGVSSVRESRRHEQPVLATVMERGEEGRSAIRRLPLTADRPDAR